MFSHVTIGTNDLAKGLAFYDALLKPLGISRHLDVPNGAAAGRLPIWIVRPIDQKPASAGNGITIGLDADTRAAVDAAYTAGMAAGGIDEGVPGLRLHYHPNYYGAYLRDPDGNKICIVCHKEK